MNKKCEYELLCYGFHILKYENEDVWYLRYREDEYLAFKKLKKCIWFCKQRRLRQKRKKINRKKRNSAKLLARKWLKLFQKGE